MAGLYGAASPFPKAPNQAIVRRMSQIDPASVPEPSPAEIRPEELAARLAAKLCHDFISPAGAIVSGLDLLEDPTAKDMRDDAMALIAASARKLTDLLSFSRVAFGSSAGTESFDSGELERLARAIFAHVRAELDWAAAPQALVKPAAVVTLNLAQLAAAALPIGGVARVEATQEGGAVRILVRAHGPRARLHPEVASGLAGQALGDGLAGRWVQAYYVQAVARGVGGVIGAQASQDQVDFLATLPA
jgi:histidine phosphotransferase ChpT